MESIHLVFRLLAFSQVFLLICTLLLFQRNRNGLLLALLAFGAFSYLAQPLAFLEFGRGYLLSGLNLVAMSIPGLLWLVGNRFFNDSEEIPAWFFPLCIAYIGLWYMGELQIVSIDSVELAAIVFFLIPQLIKLGLVGHVITMAILGRDTDLVNKRLQLRAPLAIGASAVIGIVIVVELWASGQMPLIIEAIGSVLMFAVALTANLYLLRWRDDFPLTEARKPLKKSKAESVDEGAEQTIAVIEKAMSEDRFYAGHGKTLADLAEELHIAPYRLRNLINQYMGYKNFNQFLNHYRIREAALRLHQQPELPVLSIALDVGFRSISSFNAAFRSAHNTTPTDYRASAQP